jgi:hypothetical protein
LTQVIPAPATCGYPQGMLIEVLGLPNEATAALEAALAEALARLGLEGSAEVDRVSDVGAMIARGERRPPALRVDGVVVCRKRVPGADEIVGFLRAAQEARAAEA